METVWLLWIILNSFSYFKLVFLRLFDYFWLFNCFKLIIWELFDYFTLVIEDYLTTFDWLMKTVWLLLTIWLLQINCLETVWLIWFGYRRLLDYFGLIDENYLTISDHLETIWLLHINCYKLFGHSVVLWTFMLFIWNILTLRMFAFIQK